MGRVGERGPVSMAIDVGVACAGVKGRWNGGRRIVEPGVHGELDTHPTVPSG